MATETQWTYLKQHYSNTGCVLALGAGVSKDCDLPDWYELLGRMSRRLQGKSGPNLVAEMIKAGYTYPAIAGVLEAKCPPRIEFADVLRDALYESFPYYKRSTRGKHSTAFVEFIKAHNPTLRAVAALCAVRHDNGHTYAPNPFIRGILNFNFDAVLREYTRERYRSIILRTVERPSAESIPGRINVYHVHGFLQFLRDKIGKRDEEVPDIRVFTEQEYFNFFNQPNSLFTYTFLHLLREYRMLFIGMSLNDDNIRRLLHYSQKEIFESYKKEGETDEAAAEQSVQHYTIQKRASSSSWNRIKETSLRRLGVRVLWIKDHADIPDRLKQLYESTDVKWSHVF